jgi:hypothetical protein
MSHEGLHHALKVEELLRHGSSGLEYALIKLQRGKSDFQHTLHARPTLYTFGGGLTPAVLLHRLGFSHGPCSFFETRECLAKQVPTDFDLPRFASAVESAFTELEAGIKLLFDCGFYVEHELFGERLPPFVELMLSSSSGDGHNAPKRQSMKRSEDASFDYRFTRIEGGRDKGWTFHYRPKHLPLSQEISSLLAFLGLRRFEECPEYDFESCLWRFCNFVPTDRVFDGSPEIAHKWFDGHAQSFSNGLQKLLDAHATLETFGLSLLPTVRANLPPEVVQPPTARTRSTKGSSVAPSGATYDVAISFAGAQRDIAETIALRVQTAGFQVFYDRFYPEQLWGKDLALFFDDVFRKKSRYCAIVVSPEYLTGDWTNHERQSAVARAIRERGREYILPIKLSENTELPGVPETIGYVSLTKYSVDEIAEMLIAKLRS